MEFRVEKRESAANIKTNVSRGEIFNDYNRLRKNLGGRTQGLNMASQEAVWNHIYKKYYKNILNSYGIKKTCSILEVGCNRGGVLRPLSGDGYTDLSGMDLSIKDINIARKKVPQANFVVGNALDDSSYKREKFDVIISRAVLEHIEKHNVVPFISSLYTHLSTGGILILEVPNMDWIWGGHFRYMDFTHEVGFTKESLEEVLLCFFQKVKFIYEDINEYNWKGKVSREILWLLFSSIGIGGTKENFFSPSVISIAQKRL